MNQDLQALEEKCTHLTLSRCKLEEEHQATLIKLDTETKAHENLIVSLFKLGSYISLFYWFLL